MAFMQEQARRQEEQARRQEEQARRLEEQLQRDKEEGMRRQEEQARRQEEQLMMLKDLSATVGKELKEVKEQVQRHESRIAELEKMIRGLKAGDGTVTSAVVAPSPRGFKVPPFDGSSSWSAYKIQFEAVMKSNGWTQEQALTALTLGLRNQALTVLEALGNDVTYEKLWEALEARYGDAHLEHVFRAQLKDRSQRVGETLQQWALEVEKLVRKAYQSSPALIDGNLVQAFTDGIRDLEVRAAVRLGHFKNLKDALAHALEVEAVRRDDRAHRIRDVLTSPQCYSCGERGHIRLSCRKRRSPRSKNLKDDLAHALEVEAVRRDDRAHRIREVLSSPRCYSCGERGHIRLSCPKRRNPRSTNQSPVGGTPDEPAKRVDARTTGLAGDMRAPRISQSCDGNSLIIKGEINRTPCKLTLDTGASRRIVSFRQVARWIEQLQEFDFVLQHRSGKSHGNADALSRRPCADQYKHCARHDAKQEGLVRMLRTDLSEDWKETQQMSERMKTRYDRKANNKGFEEGSLVWLHNPVRSKGKSPKLQAKWDGPYRIVTKMNDVTYRIQKGPRGTPKIVHVDRLARYYGSNNVRDEHV